MTWKQNWWEGRPSIWLKLCDHKYGSLQALKATFMVNYVNVHSTSLLMDKRKCHRIFIQKRVDLMKTKTKTNLIWTRNMWLPSHKKNLNQLNNFVYHTSATNVALLALTSKAPHFVALDNPQLLLLGAWCSWSRSGGGQVGERVQPAILLDSS